MDGPEPPLPSALDVVLAPDVDVAVNHLPIPNPGGLTPIVLKVAVASQLLIENTYNDAGRIDPHAQDLLDLLRYERGPGGRLAGYRQVNLITHSMGSLVTRAMLHKAHAAGRQDSEFVANVIYNAPSFGGSTMAYLDKLFHEGPITRDTFKDKRLQKMFTTSGTTFKDLFINFVNVLLRPTGVDYYYLRRATTNPVGQDPTLGLVIPITEPLWLAVDALDNFPISGAIDWNAVSNGTIGDALALALNLARPLVDALLGFPGAPGYDDLTPEGGVALTPPDQRAAVEATLRQTQDPARWLRLGDLLLANGEAEGALGALAQAEALGAAAIDVAVGRSAALIALGRLDEAEALLQAALLSAPQDARLYNNLGLAAR
ncbi:MAG: tetratricopeptide repeat protein, partial [Dehalococcoidia bacterium]